MEEFRFVFLQRLANGIQFLSAVVLMTGFAKGMWGLIRLEWREIRSEDEMSPESISALRSIVGNYILLGLDFYLISTIIAAMLHPELNELISLSVVGLLRTAIGFFGRKETGK